MGDDVVLNREDISTDTTIDPDIAKVMRVIDGDTIDVRIFVADENSRLQNKVERVRLIGVDTPETVHPFQLLEFFGKEASSYTKSRLEGKNIRLEYDLTKRDKYGRILAYVFIDDRHFNAELIEKGFAFAYLRFPFKYREEFRLLELKAKDMKAGMWKSDEVEEIQGKQEEYVDEELEAMVVLEELLEELEKPDEEEEEDEEKPESNVDQTGWEFVKLNEVLPNPTGKDEGLEFIELINDGKTEIELLGWEIKNNNKTVFAFSEKQQIPSSGLLVLDSFKTTLKNTTETIFLVDPLGNIRDQLSYDQAMKDDQVWSRGPITRSWQLRSAGTPGAPNELILIASGGDRDLDGLSDEDEVLLGLDPDKWDSDGDGYPDDFEMLMRYLERAEENFQMEYEQYLTNSFFLEMKQTARTLTFFGESRPYSTVQLTMYSSPQTVLIPVRGDGAWNYKVDVGLEKGAHHAEAFVIDPTGKKSLKTPMVPFVLEARINVSKLPKLKKAAKKKAPQIKPLYQVAEQTITFFEGEVASWDREKRLLTLSDGTVIQIPFEKQSLGNVFLSLGQKIRYRLEHDQITVKEIDLIPDAFASGEESLKKKNEPIFLFFIFFTALTSCFIFGKKHFKPSKP
jgi:micrococcal nuclease